MGELIEIYKPIAKKRIVSKKVVIARQKVKDYRMIKLDLEYSLCKLKSYAELKEDQ